MSKPTVKNSNLPQSLITCPHCGCQYLPSEIYVKGSLLGGMPTNIVKDALGKLLYVDYENGGEPDYEESFICEQCDKPFEITATLSFKTRQVDDVLDFSSDVVSLLD